MYPQEDDKTCLGRFIFLKESEKGLWVYDVPEFPAM
jgi:hypothetical protein